MNTLPFSSPLLLSAKKLKPPSKYKSAKTISVYEILYRVGDLKIKGFLAFPSSKKRLPCILYNRGGSKNFGLLTHEKVFRDLARIASWGYIVAASQYRGSRGSAGHDEHGGADIEDIVALRRLLRDFKRADISKLGIVGKSRGGMMTYLLLARYRWMRAAITIGGLANLERAVKRRPELKNVYREAFGASRHALRKRSALLWAKKFYRKAPILLMHGGADWRVTPFDSIDLASKFLSYRVPHRLVIFEGADHSLRECEKEVFAMMRAWLERFVRNRASIPNLKPHGP